ncbi:LuxR C-terminal-related transcriptional regulator [Streptomyces sp. NPDC052396]|uniref:response regulator transcription factor n=1 Tax=Streptomyces sp. NPDC052396 TaxID=3365689 RepID=UPI0037CE9154
MIQVLLVHDTRLLRTALAALLEKEPGIEVTTAGWRDAAGWEGRPQVCVVDMDGPEAAKPHGVRELARRCPAGDGHSALLALVSRGRPGPLRLAYEARALGYLSKNAAPEHLTDGIRQVARGERYIDESLGFGFLQAADIPLTQRELNVLSLAAEGASIDEIACGLHLANGTVRNYMAAITRKTGARNRVDAIRISRRAGWL